MPNIRRDKMKLGLMSAGQYYADGGFVQELQAGGDIEAMMADLPPEVQQIAVAVIAGEMSIDEAIAALQELGFNDEQLQQAIDVLEYLAPVEEVAAEEVVVAQDGGFIASNSLEDDEEQMAQIREMQHAQAPAAKQGALGQAGDAIKGKLISKAATSAADVILGGATGGLGTLLSTLFGEDGGLVAQPEIPPEIMDLMQAVLDGLVSPEEAIEALVAAGIPMEEATALVQAFLAEASAAPQGPLSQGFATGGEVKRAADVIVEELSSRRPAGLALPTERFEHGGEVSAMSVPAGGPVKSVKTKSKMKHGHHSEETEMALEFDTQAVPMSDMASKAFSNWK